MYVLYLLPRIANFFLIFLHVYTAPNIPHTSHRNVVCLVLCLIYTVKTVAGRLDELCTFNFAAFKLSSAFFITLTGLSFSLNVQDLILPVLDERICSL